MQSNFKRMEYFKPTTLFFLLLLSMTVFVSCGEDDVPGCTNAFADNFNNVANVDDGSCVISGCTDPAAENFNPDANRDDNGTCVFARDKFLGSYMGTINCPIISQFNSESTTVLFEPDPDDINKLLITIQNEDIEIPISATVVDGVSLELLAEDFPLDIVVAGIDVSVLVDFTGLAIINSSEDVISGNFIAAVLNAQTGAEILADGCDISATRI